MRSCGICGKEMKAVNASHLRNAHGMTKLQYLLQFPNADFGQDWFEKSEEGRKKMSQAQIGRKKSHEELEKISQKGFKHSAETKAKMSETRKGRKSWNAGLKGTIVHTEAYKEQMRKQQSLLIAERCRNKPTSIELAIRNLLSQLKISFIEQYIVGNKFSCDFFVPESNLIIECNGDYWHNRAEIISKDYRKKKYLEKCGFNLLVLWEHEINMDIKYCKNEILKWIKKND